MEGFILVYIMWDFLLSFLLDWAPVFPMTTGLYRITVNLLLKNKSCKLGVHEWRYKEEEHKITGVPLFTKTEVYVKHCTKCKKRYISLYHPGSKMFRRWSIRDDIKEGSVIKMKKL